MTFRQRWLAVFAAMFALDVAFALYVIETAAKDAFWSSTWAASIQVFNAFVVSSFVSDRRFVVPCALGAFAGTYVVVKLF